MEPLRIGLIGLGRHGMRYARHLLEQDSRCRLSAVCRQNVSLGQNFARQHGLRFHHRYQDLIDDPQVDAVVIVLPPESVAPVGFASIHAGKPLLIEKPLAANGSEARRIVAAASEKHVPLMTAQTLRYEATIRALKEHGNHIKSWKYLVLTNRLEPKLPGESQRSQGPAHGALLEIGIHIIDLVRYLTGSEVAEVRCEVQRTAPAAPEQRAWVSLMTKNNIPCLLDVSRVSAGRVTRAEIVGETETVMADWTNHDICEVTKGRQSRRHSIAPISTLPLVISGFVTALQEKTPMPITGLDGQRAVEIVDACYESARTDTWVHVAGC